MFQLPKYSQNAGGTLKCTLLRKVKNGIAPAPGAFQTSFGGAVWDAFVTKLNSTGTALVYSTFLGGTGVDSGHGIVVNAAGNAFVTGSSDSPNFPVTAGAFQTVTAEATDAFVTQLSVTGASLVYSTYLGGSGSDLANDIAIDTAGNASVVYGGRVDLDRHRRAEPTRMFARARRQSIRTAS